MAYRNFYQKMRATHQQPPTKEPCLICGATPAENCHLVACLDLVKEGIPVEFWNKEWNLIPLCEEHHWLADGRQNMWCGHKVKKGYDVRGHTKEGISKHTLLNLEYEEEREKVQNSIKSYYEKALNNYIELMKGHSFSITYHKGIIEKGYEVMSFDLERLREGQITVIFWKKDDEPKP